MFNRVIVALSCLLLFCTAKAQEESNWRIEITGRGSVRFGTAPPSEISGANLRELRFSYTNGVSANSPQNLQSYINCSYQIKAYYLGEGNPSPTSSLLIRSTSGARWNLGSGGSVSASCGTVAKYTTGGSVWPTGEWREQKGWVLIPTLGQRFVSANIIASAQAFSKGEYVIFGLSTEIQTDVVDKYLWPNMLGNETYDRIPQGGGAELNPIHKDYSVYDSALWMESGGPYDWYGYYRKTFTGSTVGNWNLPLVDLSMFIQGDLLLDNISTNLGTGQISADVGRAWMPKEIAALFKHPAEATLVFSGADIYGYLLHQATIRVHSPIEDTGEVWDVPYEGDLTQHKVGKRMFQRGMLGAVTNLTNNPVQFSLTITRSLEQTYGIKMGGTTSFEIWILKNNFGADITLNSKNSYSIGQQVQVVVPPFTTTELWAYPEGTLTFPLCSLWQSGGYAGDNQVVDARPGLIGVMIVNRKTGFQSGGGRRS